MDVNYGKELKRYLLSHVTLLRIHRFDPSDVQFEDAFVSSAIVWFRKAEPPSDHTAEFTYGGTLQKPAISKSIQVSALQKMAKWSSFPLVSEGDLIGQARMRLLDFFEIKRGLATGANDFFILTPEEAARHQLPNEFLKPILPHPQHLSSDEIKADEQGDPLLAQNLLLLSCDLPEDLVKDKYPSLWKYLRIGAEMGIDQRYLCRHRSPWYSQENRPPSPLLCPIIGRQDTKKGRPFRFILNLSRATAQNVYSMLYPRPALKRAMELDARVLRAIWQSLNDIPLDVLLREGRVYGGGLYKLEPGELGHVPADNVRRNFQGESCILRS
jgi:hypothetical protein